jgi:hypothetical protein
MKFSLVKNDKSTYWDEVILAVMVIASFAIGISLIVTKPSFWIITEATTTITGVFFVLFGVMFLPGLIYRLFTNDKN